MLTQILQKTPLWVWALLAGLITLSLSIFLRRIDTRFLLGHAYWLFPFLIWAALRFGQRGTTTALFAVSGIAIWGTAQSLGPFIGKTVSDARPELAFDRHVHLGHQVDGALHVDTHVGTEFLEHDLAGADH